MFQSQRSHPTHDGLLSPFARWIFQQRLQNRNAGLRKHVEHGTDSAVIQPLQRCLVVTCTNKIIGVHKATEDYQREENLLPLLAD